MIPDKKYVDIISNQPQTKGDQTYINNENIEVTTNGTYIAEAPYTGFGQVKVNVPNGTETLDVSENGTYTPSGTNIGFRSVNVNVAQSQVDRLDVTPTTSQQTLTPTGNIAGYNPVVVAAVTSAIDSNIKASNIKSGVTVLGVTGNVIESKTRSLSVTPTTSLQTFAPQSPYNGFSGVSVAAVTAAIDANITAGNIKAGTTILGVAGSVVELKGETRSVNLTSNSGNTFTPSSGKNGITSISVIPSNYPTNTSNYEITPSTTTRDVVIPTGFSGFNTLRVNAVTSSIDINIQPSNIKDGVTILGVTGTYSTGVNIDPLTVSPSTTTQIINTTAGVNGYAPITVNAVTASIDGNILSNNIKSGVSILGVTGNVIELKGETRSVSITSTAGNTFTPNSGKNGITSITVSPTNLATTITPTTSAQTITVPNGYSGFGTLTVSPVTSSIDSDIVAGNIKSGVNILGINGTLIPLNGETRTVSITSTAGNTFIPSSGKNGITSITVSPTNQNRTITPTTSQQTIGVNTGYSGNGTITVNAVTSAIDSNIQPANIKSGVNILGVIGTGNIVSDFYLARSINNNVLQIDGTNTPQVPNTITSVGSGALAFCGIDYGNNIVDLSGLTTVPNTYSFFRAGIKSSSSVDLSNLTTITGSHAFELAFSESNITSVDLSSLTEITAMYACDNMFKSCSNLTTIIGSSLTKATSESCCHSMFYNTGLTGTVNFLSSLKTISGTNACLFMFGNTSITSVNISNLETVSGSYACDHMFSGCSNLTTINFQKLSSISGNLALSNAFNNCTSLRTVYFRGLKTVSSASVFDSMLTNCSNVTVHFPSNFSTSVSASLLKGTGTTVLYDLAAA